LYSLGTLSVDSMLNWCKTFYSGLVQLKSIILAKARSVHSTFNVLCRTFVRNAEKLFFWWFQRGTIFLKKGVWWIQSWSGVGGGYEDNALRNFNFIVPPPTFTFTLQRKIPRQNESTKFRVLHFIEDGVAPTKFLRKCGTESWQFFSGVRKYESTILGEWTDRPLYFSWRLVGSFATAIYLGSHWTGNGEGWKQFI